VVDMEHDNRNFQYIIEDYVPSKNNFFFQGLSLCEFCQVQAYFEG
jgi:hypothetical protein